MREGAAAAVIISGQLCMQRSHRLVDGGRASQQARASAAGAMQTKLPVELLRAAAHSAVERSTAASHGVQRSQAPMRTRGPCSRRRDPGCGKLAEVLEAFIEHAAP